MARALAALLPAGMPITRALRACRHLGKGSSRAMLDDVAMRVDRGEALANAFAAHPQVFSPIHVGIVRAGERSGDLAGAFARLAAQLERAGELRSRLVSALIYPALLLLAGSAAVLLLFAFVVPRFVGLIETSGSAVPRSTAALVWLSSALRETGVYVLGGGIAAGCAVAYYARTEAGRYALSRMLFALPGIGAVRRQVEAGRFARLTGVLVSGGAPLYSALGDVAESVADPLVREEALRIRSRVREGATLHSATSEGDLFPPLLGELVAVGEESGRLGEFLVKAADILETRVHRNLERLVSLAEPVMILLLGSLIGFVALSLLQAVYGMNAGAFR